VIEVGGVVVVQNKKCCSWLGIREKIDKNKNKNKIIIAACYPIIILYMFIYVSLTPRFFYSF
jgi:hypothetical protein